MQKRIDPLWKLMIVFASTIISTTMGLTIDKLEPSVIGALFVLICWAMAYLGACAGKDARPR